MIQIPQKNHANACGQCGSVDVIVTIALIIVLGAQGAWLYFDSYSIQITEVGSQRLGLGYGWQSTNIPIPHSYCEMSEKADSNPVFDDLCWNGKACFFSGIAGCLVSVLAIIIGLSGLDWYLPELNTLVTLGAVAMNVLFWKQFEEPSESNVSYILGLSSLISIAASVVCILIVIKRCCCPIKR